MAPRSRFSIKWALFVCSTLIVLTFEGCADKIKTDLNAFKALDQSLINSNNSIKNNTETLLASLEDKRYNPRTAEKAKLWYTKAELIQKYSTNVYTYIEDLRLRVKNEAGLKTENGKESFREGDKNAAMRLFSKHGQGKELFDHIQEYTKNVLSVDSAIFKEFGKTVEAIMGSFTATKQGDNFTKTVFDDISVVAALAMLSKYQNDIKKIENKTIEFCHSQVGSAGGWGINSFIYVAAITSNYHLKAGKETQIDAGLVGRLATQPEITIEGKNIPIDASGMARYSFIAPNKPGKYRIRAEFSYTNFDGMKKTLVKDIEYTVADCQ